MNLHNRRLQEASLVKNSAQYQLKLIQTFDTTSPHVNGYRSLGFYQAARYTNGLGTTLIVGTGSGGGTTAG